MKEIPVPEDEASRARVHKKLQRKIKAADVLTKLFAVLAVIMLIGVVVSLLVYEFRNNTPATETLLLALTGGAFGGTLLFILAVFLWGKYAAKFGRADLDFRERCAGNESFFVGDGTLAAFEEDGLKIHSEDGAGSSVSVPYREVRFFRVCTRQRPRERGDWNIVIEVPVKYVAKKGQFKPNDPPALIQADYKPRFEQAVKAHGLTLLGEEYCEKKEQESGKFSAKREFFFPDRPVRKRTLILMILGAAMLVAGIPLAIFLNPSIGAILCVFGAFIGIKAGFSFRRAKSALAFYDEGFFWQDKNPEDSIFLKWREIEKITPSKRDGMPMLDVRCPYGAYHFPNPDGAWDWLEEFTDKCGDVT